MTSKKNDWERTQKRIGNGLFLKNKGLGKDKGLGKVSEADSDRFKAPCRAILLNPVHRGDRNREFSMHTGS